MKCSFKSVKTRIGLLLMFHQVQLQVNPLDLGSPSSHASPFHNKSNSIIYAIFLYSFCNTLYFFFFFFLTYIILYYTIRERKIIYNTHLKINWKCDGQSVLEFLYHQFIIHTSHNLVYMHLFSLYFLPFSFCFAIDICTVWLCVFSPKTKNEREIIFKHKHYFFNQISFIFLNC